MAIESLVVLLRVGLIAGWLASVIMGGGFGLIGNMMVGILGAFIGSYILTALGVSIATGIVGAIIHATIGAMILLFVLRLLRR